MNIIRVGNVNEALSRGIQLLSGSGCRVVSPRGARTAEWSEPVTTVYERPLERVLFSPTRDANPFFHFFESLWMLAGRNDVEFVKYFNKRMTEFSDDQKTLNGAYGFRWREHFWSDQLDAVAALLRRDPDSRRAVLSMWDPDQDLADSPNVKDVPCNTHVYFKVRGGKLNMTVCNRSNDMVWGAYGANAVHMGFLLEYMAAKIGVQVGIYTQISDSFHVYLDGPGGELWDRLKGAQDLLDRYTTTVPALRVQPYPLLSDGANVTDFDIDLEDFFVGFDQRDGDPMEGEQQPDHIEFRTPFFVNVVAPMFRAWRTRSLEDAKKIDASDWRVACVEWLQRRAKS